jgi:neutral ceramidase
MQIQAGHGRRCITPPLGIGMVGYGSRTEGAQAIHDELFVNAVVLDDGQAPIALVALDLCLLQPHVAVQFKQAISDATDLPPERFFINTSHTHAGPTLGGWGEPTAQVQAYLRDVLSKTTEAVGEALADRAPASFHVGSAPLDIGCNRRETVADGTVILGHDPEGPTMQEVTTWAFAREDRPTIVIFSTPMHGTTMGGKNLLISAEWMGWAVHHIEQDRPEVRSVFLQGCGADQDPYYSTDLGGRGTLAEVEAHGRRAATAVGEAIENSKPLDSLPMATLLREVELAPKEIGDEPRTLFLHGARLGQALLLSLSAEAFVEFAKYGIAISPTEETLVLGYTDGNIGYLCTADAYEEGGYEIRTTRVAPESEQIVKNAMDRMVADLTETTHGER